MSSGEHLDVIDRLSDDSKIALLHARKAVSQHGGVAVDLDHVAIGLLTVLEAELRSLLADGTSVRNVSGELIENISAMARPSEGQAIPMSAGVLSALERAVQAADAAGVQAANPRMLLSVIVEGAESPVRDALMKAGITPAVVRQLPIR